MSLQTVWENRQEAEYHAQIEAAEQYDLKQKNLE